MDLPDLANLALLLVVTGAVLPRLWRLEASMPVFAAGFVLWSFEFMMLLGAHPPWAAAGRATLALGAVLAGALFLVRRDRRRAGTADSGAEPPGVSRERLRADRGVGAQGNRPQNL
jgi:hypothetical protein